MPLDKYDHFDFATREEQVEFLGDNNENIRTISGDIEIGGWHSGYIESEIGNVEIHSYNSGGIELNEGNIIIHGNNSGSISTKEGNIRIWGENTHVIETKSGNISVRNNKGTIMTETGTIRVGNLDIKIIKNLNSELIIRNGNRSIKDILTNANKKLILPKDKEYKVLVGEYEIDFYNKKITTNGIDCNTDENFLDDAIRFVYQGQAIFIMEDRVLVTLEYKNKEKKKQNKGLDKDLREYIK